jgi:H+/Cl- antiporter ClcA
MSQPAAQTPVTRTPEFWQLLGWAAALGTFMGLVAVAFLALIDLGIELIWPDATPSGLFSGKWWFIPLIGAFGLVVGLLRRALRVEPVIPGLFEEIQERRVEPRVVFGRVAVAFVSLISGASVGPEAPLATMGGGAGTWVSERWQLSTEMREANVLSGMAGAFGGFFAAPIISALLVVEASTPSGTRRYVMTALPGLTAATMGFSVFYLLSGGTLLDIYQVPPYDFSLANFLIAIPLGVLGALISALLGLTMGVVHISTARFRPRPILLATLGGVAIGAIAWAVPLSLFSGTTQLATALEKAPELGAFLLVILVVAKIVAMALSFGTGFYGGPIFPMIFIGGVAGAAVHAVIPGIPEGLAVACLFAAVPGSGAPIPYTMVLLAGLGLTLSSPVEAAPAAIATVVAYSIYTGFLDRRPPTARPKHTTEE